MSKPKTDVLLLLAVVHEIPFSRPRNNKTPIVLYQPKSGEKEACLRLWGAGLFGMRVGSPAGQYCVTEKGRTVAYKLENQLYKLAESIGNDGKAKP